MIDLACVIGKPWETVFSVVDRRDGTLKEIDEPQSEITHEFFTGLDEQMTGDAPEKGEADDNGDLMPAAASNAANNAGEEMKDNRNLNDRNNA